VDGGVGGWSGGFALVASVGGICLAWCKMGSGLFMADTCEIALLGFEVTGRYGET
jgi:hypothetical protein